MSLLKPWSDDKHVTIYMSHPIRGSAEKEAQGWNIVENARRAYNLGEDLSLVFPSCVEWYIPSDHDLFPQILWTKYGMTAERILEVDCDIVQRCDGLLAACWTTEWDTRRAPSEGMDVEIQCAKEHGIERLVRQFPAEDGRLFLEHHDWIAIADFVDECWWGKYGEDIGMQKAVENSGFWGKYYEDRRNW